MALNEIRQPGEDDPARHPLRKRRPEGDIGPLRRLAGMLHALGRRIAQPRVLAVAAGDAIDRDVGIGLHKAQELSPCLCHSRQRRLCECNRLALPRGAAKMGKREIGARRKFDGHERLPEKGWGGI